MKSVIGGYVTYYTVARYEAVTMKIRLGALLPFSFVLPSFFEAGINQLVRKENTMRNTHLFKLVPVAAIVMGIYSTGALAGATNRGDNTAATPGPKATTTTTPAHGETNREDIRRGTTQTENVDTPDSASDLNRAGSGSAGGTGSNSNMKSDADRNIKYGPTKGQQSTQQKSGQDAAGSGSAGGRGDVGGQTLPEQLEQDPSDDTYDSNRGSTNR